jgi:hypothetical protein
MNYELQFLIMAEGNLSDAKVRELIVSNIPGTKQVSFRPIEWDSNQIDVLQNENYDCEKARKESDNFLHFKFRIEVFPIEDVSINHQVYAARHLAEHLKLLGLHTVIVADFEDLLLDDP